MKQMLGDTSKLELAQNGAQHTTGGRVSQSTFGKTQSC
jgi:hypothetical protein